MKKSPNSKKYSKARAGRKQKVSPPKSISSLKDSIFSYLWESSWRTVFIIFLVLIIPLGYVWQNLPEGGEGLSRTYLLSLLPFGPVPLNMIVATDLTKDECEELRRILKDFESQYKKQNVIVQIKNTTQQKLFEDLKKGGVDLITFDVNGDRQRLVIQELIDDLTEYEKELIPSTTHLVIKDYLKLDEDGRPELDEAGGGCGGCGGCHVTVDKKPEKKLYKLYFIPFRLSTRIVFLNKKGFQQLGAELKKNKNGKERKLGHKYRNIDNHPDAIPKTWKEVLCVAERFSNNKYKKIPVAVQATENTKALLLLELIRSAGGDPKELGKDNDGKWKADENVVAALDNLRRLWPHVKESSEHYDFQYASSYLLTEEIFLGRNWSCTLQHIEQANREKGFIVYEGWNWENREPSYLLGGEFLAVPAKSHRKDLARDLIRFLTSYENQKKLVENICWPPLLVNTSAIMTNPHPQWSSAINNTLRYAKPTPVEWPEMKLVYDRFFEKIIKPGKNKNTEELESILKDLHREIKCALRKREKKINDWQRQAKQEWLDRFELPLDLGPGLYVRYRLDS